LRELAAEGHVEQAQRGVLLQLRALVGQMPHVAAPLLDRDVADLSALADEDLGRACAIAGLVVLLGDVLVEVVELRASAGDDQRVGQNAGVSLVREVLADDRLVEDHAVGDVEERAAREEGGVEGGEAVAVGVHKGEEPRLDELGMVLRRLAKRLEDDALRQRLGEDQLLAVEVLERRELVGVESADVGAPPLLVGLARHGQALVRVQRLPPDVAQPARFALELVQGLRVDRHVYPTEPSISSCIRRFSSTAYSRGSSLVNGSMKPLTIIVSASARVMPRLIR